MPEYLSPKELAYRLGVHADTVYRWTKLPNFPGLLRPGKCGRMLIDWETFVLWDATKPCSATEDRSDQPQREMK